MASLFFTWLTIPLASSTGGPTTRQSLDGWTALESGDAVLLFIAFVVLGLVALRRIEGPWLLLLAAGALAVVITFVLSSVPITQVSKQVYSSSGYSYDAAKGTGIWIAAAGTSLLLIGGVIQARAWISRRQPGARRRGPAPHPGSTAQPGSAPAGSTRRAPAAGRDAAGGVAFPDRGSDAIERWPSRR
ncbi:MAG: hypothetical protein ACRDL6_06330 [Solirubrobacterales bacterium]